MAHPFDPGTEEAEAGGWLGVQGQFFKTPSAPHIPIRQGGAYFFAMLRTWSRFLGHRSSPEPVVTSDRQSFCPQRPLRAQGRRSLMERYFVHLSKTL